MRKKVPPGRGASEIRGTLPHPPISMLGDFRVIRSSEKKYHLRGQLQGRTRSNIEIGGWGLEKKAGLLHTMVLFFALNGNAYEKAETNQPTNQPASQPTNEPIIYSLTRSLNQPFNTSLQCHPNHQSRDDFNPVRSQQQQISTYFSFWI